MLDRNKQPFSWDDESEQETMVKELVEPEMTPIPEIPAEMPGVSLERNQPTPAVSGDDKKDNNEEATAAEEIY